MILPTGKIEEPGAARAVKAMLGGNGEAGGHVTS